MHLPPQRSAECPLPPPGHPERHPPRRWVVEVAHSWFNRFRRLLIRWEKRPEHYLAFVQLAACRSSIASCAMPAHFPDRL